MTIGKPGCSELFVAGSTAKPELNCDLLDSIYAAPTQKHDSATSSNVWTAVELTDTKSDTMKAAPANQRAVRENDAAKQKHSSQSGDTSGYSSWGLEAAPEHHGFRGGLAKVRDVLLGRKHPQPVETENEQDIELPKTEKHRNTHARKEPSSVLDTHTVKTNELKFDREPNYTLTIDQIKRGFDNNSLPPSIQNDRIIRESIESIYKNNINSPAEAQINLDQILQNDPELARVLESHFNGDKRTVSYESKRLTAWADRTLKGDERANFRKDMADFEARAVKDGICTGDVSQTYREINRLIAAVGEEPLTTLQRQHLAQEILHQAAVPSSIDQGQYNTCNVTAIESRTYTRTPAEAAKLVSAVALTGQYRTTDDTIIRVDQVPHGESTLWPVPDGSRSHASELFQVTAVNVHYARHGDQKIHYVQGDPKPGDKSDNGERLITFATKPPGEVMDGNGKPLRRPELAEGQLSDISNQISRRLDDNEVVIAAASNFVGEKTGVLTVNSDEELAADLRFTKENKKFPIIVRVDTNNEPFFTDSGRGSAGGSGGGHVVTITDYDPVTKRVCIDNQWGKKADRGPQDAISVHDLYTAMQSTVGAEQRLSNDVIWNRQHNISDPMKEMELVRMQKYNGRMTDAEFQNKMVSFIVQSKERWDKGVPEYEKQRDRQEIGNMVHMLPAPLQINMIIHQQNKGLIDTQRYIDELQVAGWKMGRDHRYSSHNQQVQIDYQKGQTDLMRAISIFPADKQRAMLDKIAQDIKNNP